MSISSYITELQETKTYEAGLIKFQEYNIKSNLFGLIRTLPSVPRADENRHVVVLKMVGDQPNLLTVLNNPNKAFNPNIRDANKLLFVFVEMKRHITQIEAPPEGYQLGDGHQISANLQVTYEVADAEDFWKGAKDPLAEFEAGIFDAAKSFFLNTTSNFLVNSPAAMKQSLERHIQETGMIVLKHDLEQSIRRNCEIAGIRVVTVNADVFLSEALRKHLQRIHDRIYGEGGTADRWKIDHLIDSDTTFSPYSLRTVIRFLDMGLLENFYTMDWSAAMRRVYDKLAEAKAAHFQAQQDAEINRMRKLIDTAREVGLDEIEVKDLKSKLAVKMSAMADEEDRSKLPSDNEFLKLRIGDVSTAEQLTSGTKKQLASPTDNET
jgi:hypothetical protein